MSRMRTSMTSPASCVFDCALLKMNIQPASQVNELINSEWHHQDHETNQVCGVLNAIPAPSFPGNHPSAPRVPTSVIARLLVLKSMYSRPLMIWNSTWSAVQPAETSADPKAAHRFLAPYCRATDCCTLLCQGHY
jgi:hypothetical protein